MSKSEEQLLITLTRVCTFIFTSRNWEDYDSMFLDMESVNAMRKWLSANNIQTTSNNEQIQRTASSQFNTLKTDWYIGLNQIVNTILQLDDEGKLILKKYLNEAVPSNIKSDIGVEKALDIINKELYI
tara:strand:+ start:15881 stop:16264 length:384 start_codon:yes stop_codon:yes gene_type:complete